MAYSVREERQSLATVLRDKLDESERAILQLRRDNAESFLMLLDSIEECFSQLESSGLDLRPEQSRWLSLQGKLRGDAGRIVRVLDNAGGLRQLRKRNSPAQGMWWRLDEVVAANRRNLIRKFGMTFGTVALFVAMVWALFEFIPVDANTVIASEAITSARQLTLEENWSDALAVIEEAKFELTQPDAELLIWEAVVRDILGQDEIVDDTLAEAIALIDPDQKPAYWWTLGSAYLTVGDLEKARKIGEDAIRLYPLDPQGYYVLGTVSEMEGDTGAAIELFEKTFELAIESNTELAVVARVRMGTLLQRPVNMFPAVENQPANESESDGD
ncbi:MAG: hypothetical protein OXO50_21145 [Caldilineaceae bacterium]|nr:hypothetical protein [Caldilineaceae bacterium]